MNNYGNKAPINGSTRYFEQKNEGKPRHNLLQQVAGPAKWGRTVNYSITATHRYHARGGKHGAAVAIPYT